MENLISIEEARKAKELGFNENVDHYYIEFNHDGTDHQIKLIASKNVNVSHQSYAWQYNAPTKSQLQNWLKKNNHV